MTAFFWRFSWLIAEISGACTRHSSGVTLALTFSQTGAVDAWTSGVKGRGSKPSYIAVSRPTPHYAQDEHL